MRASAAVLERVRCDGDETYQLGNEESGEEDADGWCAGRAGCRGELRLPRGPEREVCEVLSSRGWSERDRQGIVDKVSKVGCCTFFNRGDARNDVD